MVKVRVPGSTANMGPGFDVLGLALSLYNEIEVELLANEELLIEYSGLGEGKIACDGTNLIYQAIKSVFDKLSKPLKGIHVKIVNEIPLMGGLGSSSSAIVSGLVAANTLCDNALSTEELLVLAVELDGHPDNVTPALYGGFTFSFRHQDGLPGVTRLRFPVDLDIIAVTPGFSVSTHEARKVMPKQYPIEKVIHNAVHLFRLIKALENNDLAGLQYILDDVIHQPYRFALVPGLKRASDQAYAAGAVGSFISGSGPTLLALANQNKEQIAKAVAEVFEAEGLDTEIRYLQPDLKGAVAISE